MGAYYPPEVFLRTPVSQLHWLIREVRFREYDQANRLSHSVARLSTVVIGVAQGFAGVKNTNNIPEAKSFLPFPDLDQFREENHAHGPSPETVNQLQQLLKTGRLPLYVFTALMYPASGDG